MAETFHFSEGSIKLNDHQAAIVRSPHDVNMRVIAAAGSGKTSTLTGRISYLLTHYGAKPSQIILLSFTHNAATMMRQRLESLVGSQRILCGTFHAISQQILREQDPAALQDMFHVDELPLKALDFLHSDRGKAWVTKTIRWIFIDEYQDINDTQYDMIRALHHKGAMVTIVGDDAQNIYTWRGSCVDYILNFHKKFPDVMDFQLSTNYRSTAAIVAVANSTMRFIPTLPHKELMTAATPAGDRPEVHYFARTSDERDWVVEAATKALTQQTGTVAILSKFNSVLYKYEEAFMKLGVRVRFVQGEETTSAHGPPTVYLSTFHGSKGLEWDHVFLVRMNDEVFPQQKDDDSVMQERRLFYVAVTRARRYLYFTYSKQEKSLSRFVREVHRPLLVWRNLPFYELSTLQSSIAPIHVQDWVNYLAGEDYRTIKQLQVLPAVFKDARQMTPTLPTLAPGTNLWVTPYWWSEQGMSAEFYDFLRAFWLREMAMYRPESGGQWDRDAQQTIWTIKIAPEDVTLFETHRELFEKLATRFFGATPRGEAPPQIYYTEILSAIHALHPQNDFAQTDFIRIIQIIHKMRTVLYNLRFAKIALHELRFAAIRHSPPQEARCELITAWRSYTDGHPLPDDAPIPLQDLHTIYQIGLCRAIAEGRSGVLAALPGEREWSKIRPFLTDFRARIRSCAAAAKSTSVLCRIQITVNPGITTAPVTAEADMLLGTTAWFFVAGDQPNEMQRLERMLTILLTVHGLRLAGHVVKDVCLYQLITGTTLQWSVEDWTPSSSELLTAFIQARVQHTMMTHV